MILPGKITLCRIEEDNPAKSFFRIRPLLVNNENSFEKAEGALEQFQDEGGIRIVPDRNEVARFKTRMRTLGSYCLLDLIRHTGENDKIRPNKNYSPERGELNRNIVYSDVIVACPDCSVMEVLTPDKNEQGIYCAPAGVNVGTSMVLLRVDGAIKGPYKAERKSEEEPFTFTEDSAHCLSEVAEDILYEVDAGNGSTVKLFISSTVIPEAMKSAEPAKPHAAKPQEAPKPAEEVKPEAPAAEAKPEEPAAAEATESEKPAVEVKAEETATAEAPKPAEPEKAAEPEQTAEPAKPQEPVKPAETPRVQGPSIPRPIEHTKPAEPVDSRRPLPRPEPRPMQRPEPRPEPRFEERPPRQMPARDFNRAPAPAPRSGALNPRRGMSLAEYVDDSWKRTRFEQLSAGVTGTTGSTPVMSPVEKTAAAVRELMRVPEGRNALVKELGEDIFAAPAAQTPRDTHMDELEAERLRLMCEIDNLKRSLTDSRAELMEEARRAHADETARMEQEKAKLAAEVEASRREADSARHAQVEAAKLLDGGSRAKLDNDFLKFAMFSKAAQLLREDNADYDDYAGVPETFNATAELLVNETRARFEEAGRPITNDEAVNLLVCAAVGSCVVISGPTGSGKTSLADSLAGALGLSTPGCRRYFKLGPDVTNARRESAYKALCRYTTGVTQRFVLLDDINAVPCADQARGLLTAADKATDPSFTLFMTVLDDQIGYPVDSRILDRAFMIRLKPRRDTFWKRSAAVATAHRAPSIESVKAAFMNCDSIPAAVVSRVKQFTDRLAALDITLSARTMSDMYAYCAAACPLMSSPLRALDYAIAQRALPVICATAKLPALRKLPELVCDLPESSALLACPLPVAPVI